VNNFCAVIFDLDGVIADTHPLHTIAWRRLLEEQGKKPTEAELAVIREGKKRTDILVQFFGALSAEEIYNLGVRKDELLRTASEKVKPVAGLIEFLDELETFQIPKAVATSASRLRAEKILSELHLSKRFVAVITGDDVQRGKPDPSIFLLAANHLGSRASEVLVIEDSIAGVRAAKSAGMKCVGLAAGDFTAVLYQSGADYVIPGFSKISWLDLCEIMDTSSVELASELGST